MFTNGNDDLSRMEYEHLLADADMYRAFFTGSAVSRGALLRSRRTASSICRAVEAITHCQWESAARLQSQVGSAEIPAQACAALQVIAHTLRGSLGAAERMLNALSVPDSEHERGPECWAVETAAHALWSYATGSAPRALGLPLIMKHLVRELPGTAEGVHDLLCFALALAATAQHDAALASFLLGHYARDLSAGAFSQVQTNIAARATFGFSVIALGDASTGRRILLGISADGERSRVPLVAGIVDCELVGLQTAAGDMTSASHWLARTQRFADRYDCRLLARRAIEATGRPAVAEQGI